jgi:hypothetical protein
MSNMPEITFYEGLFFILLNIILILSGVLLWYYMWVKTYGGVIPNPQFADETDITYFNSKNLVIVFYELWKRIKNLDKKYFIRSVGMESYVYLLFQRRIIKLLFFMSLFSLFFSFITTIANTQEDGYSALHDFLLNNKYVNDFSTVIHLISLVLFTFLHFRYFTVLKNETSNLYFERFDKMSRTKNADWLASRTLHISGLKPNERNSINKYLIE